MIWCFSFLILLRFCDHQLQMNFDLVNVHLLFCLQRTVLERTSFAVFYCTLVFNPLLVTILLWFEIPFRQTNASIQRKLISCVPKTIMVHTQTSGLCVTTLRYSCFLDKYYFHVVDNWDASVLPMLYQLPSRKKLPVYVCSYVVLSDR